MWLITTLLVFFFLFCFSVGLLVLLSAVFPDWFNSSK